MIEQVQDPEGDSKVVEKVIQDENVHYMHRSSTRTRVRLNIFQTQTYI